MSDFLRWWDAVPEFHIFMVVAISFIIAFVLTPGANKDEEQ